MGNNSNNRIGVGASNKYRQNEDAVHQQRREIYFDDQVSDETSLPGHPCIIPRDEHCISRRNIDPDVLKVMYRLLRHGHLVFLVGGSVRDLLLGKNPKDFDMSTDVRPNEMRSLFRNSRIIGKRFRLVHVFFGNNKIIEVSTFRKSSGADEDGAVQTLAADNTFGDPETDALRRDITINGLFYDVRHFSVVDYVGGMEDLRNGIVRIIGDPHVRIKEDPVRALRAIRHAARNDFSIHPSTYDAICDSASQITLCPKSRISEELIRELRYGASSVSFALCEKTGLLKHLMPPVWTVLQKGSAELGDNRSHEALHMALRSIDQRSRQGIELSPSLLFATLFIGLHEAARSQILYADTDMQSTYVLDQVWGHHPFADRDGSIVTSTLSVDEVVRLARNGVVHASTMELCRQLGVSRKERDHMEQLLIARLQMFGAFLGQSDVVVFPRKSYFRDALELLRLTAYDDLSQQCYEFWALHANSSDVDSSGIRGRVEVARTKYRNERSRGQYYHKKNQHKSNRSRG